METKNQAFTVNIIKKQVARIILIPLVIILILLIIVLTFSSPSYHYTDYFYSKNIQINKKVRGIIPPLNQTQKDHLIGWWKIGIVQSFVNQERRKFINYTLQLTDFNSITLHHKLLNCHKDYKIKIYGSSIFIKQNQLQTSQSYNQSQDVCQQSLDWIELNSVILSTKIWTFAQGNMYFISFPQQNSKQKIISVIFTK